MKRETARRNLMSARADAVFAVNAALANMGKKLWRVSEMDGLRLTRLLAWGERYSVSVEYILRAVLPVLSKAVERRTGKKSKGLGTSIAVLTGQVSREILQEKIAKDFKGGENINSTVNERQNAMINILDDELNGKPKNPLTFKTSEGYVNAYTQSIKRKRKDREKLEDQIAKQPFRNNPFR